MKWKDLSLKERKQIYDSVRANNPDATYLDIKQQFDSIPAYQDGKGKTIKDMTKRGSYVKWGDTDKDGYGQINIKNIKDNILPTDIMEILMPLGGAGFVGHELNKE